MMKDQLFSSIPIEELTSIIREIIKEEVSEVVDKQKFEPLISRKEAASFLKVSLVTLNNWREQGLIPSYKMNSRVYFKKSELITSLNKLPNRKGRRKK